MIDPKFTYLALLLLTLVYPVWKSFDARINFYKKLKYILPAIIITAVPFIIWDVIFENNHIWTFSSEYTIGVTILGLPLEEWLFFLVIPYACIFIYETMIYFTGHITFRYIRQITFILAVFLLITGVFTLHLSYTSVSFLLAAIILFIIARKNYIAKHLSNFFKGYLVSLIPFFLVNGVLTKLPVVSYNNEENLSFRIYSIPIEDAVYLLSLLLINFSLYEIFRHYARKRQHKNKAKH